jgi:hypothetical protein
VAGSAHDGREDGTGRVVSGETGLAHSGPIVHNESGNIVVTHFYWFASGEILLKITRKVTKLSMVLFESENRKVVFVVV